MNNQHDPLSELIDSCRHADDLRLPELQPLSAAVQRDPSVDHRLKKSQRIDAMIGRSVRDVPIPPGLEQRLLAALEANRPNCVPANTCDSGNTSHRVAGEKNADLDLDPVGVASGTVRVGSNGRRQPWKIWLATASSVAALVLIAVFAFSGSTPQLQTQDAVAIEAAKWLGGLRPQWSSGQFPDDEYPMPSQLRLRRYGWQQVSGSHASLQVVCYNIPSTPAPTYLFVCRGATPIHLPNELSTTPANVVSGWQLGSWQTKGLVYVLAVQGTQQHYRAVVKPNARIASAVRLPVTS